MPLKKRVKPPAAGLAPPTRLQKRVAVNPTVVSCPPFPDPASHLHSLPSSPPSPPTTHVEGMQLPGSGCQEQQLLGDRGGIIAQQQKELELMILELQDRDVELNSLVEIQQRQATVWTEDRRKMLELEQKCTQLEELTRTSDKELSQVKTSLTETQCREREQAATIRTLQLRLRETEGERNGIISLVKSMKAQVSEGERDVARLQERLTESERRRSEVQGCLLTAQQERDETMDKLTVVQRREEEREKELETLHTQQRSSQHELSRKEEEKLKLQQEIETLRTQLIASSAQLEQLKMEVRMGGECDKRKEKLLQLQRSRLERHMQEMDTLKKMCGRQDEQIAYLEQQLHDTTIHPPSPFCTQQLQGYVQRSEFNDELTELLEHAGMRTSPAPPFTSSTSPAPPRTQPAPPSSTGRAPPKTQLAPPRTQPALPSSTGRAPPRTQLAPPSSTGRAPPRTQPAPPSSTGRAPPRTQPAPPSSTGRAPPRTQPAPPSSTGRAPPRIPQLQSLPKTAVVTPQKSEEHGRCEVMYREEKPHTHTLSHYHHSPSSHRPPSSHHPPSSHRPLSHAVEDGCYKPEHCVTPSNDCHGYPKSSGRGRDGTLGIDVDHLAEEVRERLVDIFDSLPTHNS